MKKEARRGHSLCFRHFERRVEGSLSSLLYDRLTKHFVSPGPLWRYSFKLNHSDSKTMIWIGMCVRGCEVVRSGAWYLHWFRSTRRVVEKIGYRSVFETRFLSARCSHTTCSCRMAWPDWRCRLSVRTCYIPSVVSPQPCLVLGLHHALSFG